MIVLSNTLQSASGFSVNISSSEKIVLLPLGFFLLKSILITLFIFKSTKILCYIQINYAS